jgi:hypothetical protein
MIAYEDHTILASMNRGEISSSAIASAPNVGLVDDLTHRTPHFGYTSELRLHHESIPVLSSKTKDMADSRFRQDSQSVHAKDSHDRASRERGNLSTRGRQEPVRCCCLIADIRYANFTLSCCRSSF